MKTARTIEPYIAGAHMKEELEHDFHVPLVHGTICNGFTPAQRTNKNLKCIIEQEIIRLMEERKHSTGTVTTGMDEEERVPVLTTTVFLSCGLVIRKPCFHSMMRSMAYKPAMAFHCPTYLGMYRQMGLVINGGPTGKGVQLELPICVVNEVREMFPESDKRYMGHMEE
jgi:hypothetical protein